MYKRGIAFILSDDYFEQLKVALYTLLKYNKIDFDIIIFYDKKENLNKIKSITVLHKDINFIFKKINKAPYKDIDFCNKNRNWGITPGFRFEIFKLKDYDEVLYLDCDILILKNILDIFSIPGEIVVCKLNHKTSHNYSTQIGFNAGVMLVRKKYLNLKTWKKILQYSRLYKDISGNQILLNKFFQGKVVFADQIYNVTTDLLTLELLIEGRIYHFIGSKKPINLEIKNSFNDYVLANTGLALLSKLYLIYKKHQQESHCFYKIKS